MKIAKGSKSYILTPFFIGIIFLLLTLYYNFSALGLLFLLLTLITFRITSFIFLFFRDPDRVIGKDIVASADGKIIEIAEEKDDDVGDCTKISTFMNLYNVHVNRTPIEGTIRSIEHKSGFHIPAFKKESEKNERVILILDTKIGPIKIIQIAGTIARRIVPYVKKRDKLKKGEKIGIIRFGSRVDVYLPKKIKDINVKKGDKVKAGESTIAKIND